MLGQNVNAYRGPMGDSGEIADFALLIEYVAEIPGIERIRYTTSHPNDMADGLIAAHRDIPKLMPFLHLPVQAGSDRILKAMNRSHTADGYLRLIDRVRAVRPDIALSGDFIVGFPGETEADFAETLALVETVGYAQAFSFAYSARPGTPESITWDRTDCMNGSGPHMKTSAPVGISTWVTSIRPSWSPSPGVPSHETRRAFGSWETYPRNCSRHGHAASERSACSTSTSRSGSSRTSCSRKASTGVTPIPAETSTSGARESGSRTTSP